MSCWDSCQGFARAWPAATGSSAIRTVQKVGGLDSYLVGTDDAKLPPEGLHLKRLVKKALRGRRAAATA